MTNLCIVSQQSTQTPPSKIQDIRIKKRVLLLNFTTQLTQNDNVST